MGVINCTPDSFYEGSRSEQLEHSMEIVEKMINEGADWIDIGGESTRPGATEVSVDEEIRRTAPLILEIRKRFPDQAISIDTRRHQVAKEAIIAGANMINDVSGLRDPEMRELVLSTEAHVCIMHMQGEPSNMQKSPQYTDVVQEVSSNLLTKARELVEQGHSVNRICLDPGIGFGKNLKHNMTLIQNISIFHSLGFPILVGNSRKSFVKKLSGKNDSRFRIGGTMASSIYLMLQGVQILRIHDVNEIMQGIKVFKRIINN